MVTAVLLAIILAAVFFLLYNYGVMAINSKSAVSYIGSSSGNGARFTSCSGYVKRIVRFKQTGVRTVVLDAALTKGDISVELLDSAKQKIMQLDCTNPRASVTVEKSKKYYLLVKFKSATGRYALIRE